MRCLTFPPAEVRVYADVAQLSRAAADEFERVAEETLAKADRFRVALAGGTTPRAVHSVLALDHQSGARQLPWERVDIFFGDERHVGPDHPGSNYRMARETLLDRVPIPASNVHRIRAEAEPAEAAAEYERELRREFGVAGGVVPRFNLILLGMGPDGHTSSLFPGTAALTGSEALVCT